MFTTPRMDPQERWVIERVEELRSRLRHQIADRRRWVGSLRRVTLARNIQGSNSIEGYNVSLDDAVAAAAGEVPMDADYETRAAIEGYRAAMTYVLQLADDPHFEYSETLIRSLHYMMLSYDLTKWPGRWRAGAAYVRRDETGEIVYEGPDAGDVPSLMADLSRRLRADKEDHVLVRAAMAHLNLAMIHPFRDGNGRMARCLQTLVLAREGIVAPEFSSIEEHLGRNTEAYYAVLALVGGGSWQPERDARPWVRFCLTAHYHQARTILRRIEESESRWTQLERLVAAHSLPERAIPALFDASMGFRVRNATYRVGAEVTKLSASRDLRALVEAGLLAPRGEKRGRFYVRTEELEAVDRAARGARPGKAIEDPFELARAATEQPTLGLSVRG